MGDLESNLQFSQMVSFIQPSFWNKFVSLKINVDKLEEPERHIWGYNSYVASHFTVNILEVDSTSFNSNFDSQNKYVPYYGKMFNKNTIEQFKECDKSLLINNEGDKLIKQIKNGTILETPSMLNNFFILSFSDLKKYLFYYWFAFPVPYNFQITLNSVSEMNFAFSDDEMAEMSKQYQTLTSHQKPYILIEKNESLCKIHTLSSKLNDINATNYSNIYFTFTDYFFNENPKTQLKNYILLILHYCNFLCGKKVNFLQFCYDSKMSCKTSKIYLLTLPELSDISKIENWVGWEKNENNKLGPRLSNMKAVMDPKILFEESVELNLKLMKWRLLPNIDLEKIKNTKCLLLGAGTLGCSVARTLIGWGVRNITFVDNSVVSASNPIRQILFTYEDSVKSFPKASAAADNLKKIFPAINSKGFQLTIPMPGHSVGENTMKSTKNSVQQLEDLIKDNDIIFLLTDSRESRWLPTLLCCYYNKTVVNVALGFDTYLIMRYGGRRNGNEAISSPPGFQAIEGGNLGCYFCSDVTAPGNSMKDRTLDQQCTVTRPGTSLIAGAMAVELAIALIQHKKGVNAPAFYKLGVKNDFDLDCDEYGGILGLIPHSIRGFLSTFSNVLPATEKYNQCIACSKTVLDKYGEKGFEFLCDAFNSSKYLEELTGLNQLEDENNFIDVLEFGDEDV